MEVQEGPRVREWELRGSLCPLVAPQEPPPGPALEPRAAPPQPHPCSRLVPPPRNSQWQPAAFVTSPVAGWIPEAPFGREHPEITWSTEMEDKDTPSPTEPLGGGKVSVRFWM
nr:histone acetyltransferase KAT6A-like [Taeniopygia guttata]